MDKRLFISKALPCTLLLAACSQKQIVCVDNSTTVSGTHIMCVPLERSLKHVSMTEITDGRKSPLACQAIGDSLYFKLDCGQSSPSVRTFEVKKTKTAAQNAGMKAVDDGESVTLSSNGRNILSYHYALQPAPKGARTVFARGGFIHPAHTPSGFTLTRIQPDDHLHHYGIWNPWTHLEYKGHLYDLWNLGDSLGTVRAKGVDKVYEGEVSAGLDAALEHVAFAPEGEVKLLDEQWRIRAYETGDGFIWDFESRLTPCTEEPVIIRAYRYQGFSIRANEYWTRENCHMMTSEGMDRQHTDGSCARWVYVQGRTGDTTEGGFMFMEWPDNQNSPEPLRIWDENAKGGRGDLFVNFCPAKNEDWILQPHQTYVLRYRVLAFDGKMDSAKAERMWKAYTQSR